MGLLKDSVSTATNAAKGNRTVMMVLGIVMIVTILGILYNFIKKFRDAQKIVGDKAGDTIVSQQTGISMPRLEVCKQVAQQCHKAVETFWGINYNTDEEQIISALNQLVTSDETYHVSNLFMQLNGKSLKGVVDADLNNTEKARIKPIVYTNLK